ncbi:MAG: hypothetical protein ACOX60_12905 [Massiliimalia sp.]|jgi:dsDNA-binding SOS-regulon protein
MTVRKKLIFIISILLAVVLVACTFLSRQNSLNLLPQVEVGYPVPGEMAFEKTYLGEKSGENKVSWEISAEEHKAFSGLDTVQIKVGETAAESCPVLERAQTEAGCRYTAEYKGDLSDTIRVTMENPAAQFTSVFPADMVVSSEGQEFVYGVRWREGVFGEEYVVVLLPVEVICSDGTQTAITDTSFGLDMPILSADQKVMPGDVVKVMNE